MPPEKRALLLQRLPPLSFSQRRLWELERHGASNVAALPVRLSGALDNEALTRSLSEMARRHEVLRAVFPVIDGRPRQVSLPAKPVSVPVMDLRGRAVEEREAETQRLFGAIIHERFDLERGPLWRVLLLRIEDEEHIVLLAAHHMIFDGLSNGVLLREVAQCYEAYRHGRDPQLPALPIQYGDYARWQREQLSGERLKPYLDYWRAQLSGMAPLMELPADHARPAQAIFNAASVQLQCDADTSISLKRLCAREGVSLFMAGLAAFVAMLHARAGADDMIIGIPVAGRNLAGTEALIGSFVNILLLRLRLTAETTVGELLNLVRNTTLEAYEHQDLPFAMLLEELYPGEEYDSYGVRGQAPLFRVAFDFKSVPTDASFDLPGLKVSLVEMDDKSTGGDLYIKLWEQNQLVAGSFLYNSDLFNEDSAARMAGEYVSWLRRIATRYDSRVTELAQSVGTDANGSGTFRRNEE
ncbi:MAG TPA: condensation domain-containing protein [Blastocatellia bacterium]|nr:condensation domain-containing protein [Blastocatellia bacterium]